MATPDRVLVLDLETTSQWEFPGERRGRRDPSPYHPANKLVSAHWRRLGQGEIGPARRSVFWHRDVAEAHPPEPLQEALDWAELVVAHNAKFDLGWLLEAGFRLPERAWCTQIGEYVLARARRWPLSLEESAKRRGVALKQGELIHDYFHDQRLDFSEIPWEIVSEYADADVLSCAELYLEQMRLYGEPEHRGLWPTANMMQDMLWFCLEIERNGVAIDRAALEVVRQEYEHERETLHRDLQAMAEDVLGDTPFNLNSNENLSTILYSRIVTDKPLHRDVFNIYIEENGKRARLPRMSQRKFQENVRRTTRVARKTQALHCHTCQGRGTIRKIKKNGEPYKKDNTCPQCGGRGFLLVETGKTAGYKLVPAGPADTAVHGFAVDKDAVKSLMRQAEEKGYHDALVFLTKLQRYNQVRKYLDSFVYSIQARTRPNGILHPTFNQTVARTGRLSSTEPNFQNQPKKGFPVRRAVVSRWADQGGTIIEADFSRLEWVTAGELSRDPKLLADIAAKKDAHKLSASIVHGIPEDEVTPDQRGAAKPHTFAPLYGATGAQEPPHIRRYYEQLFVVYPDLGKWHQHLLNTAVTSRIIRIPSGREYYFEHAKRLPSGSVTQATNIKNYPVQGFATGDLVPLACIRFLRFVRKHGLKSKPILTVHDSIVVDVFPGEREQVVRGLVWAMRGVPQEVLQRYDYQMVVELDIELNEGRNWLDGQEIILDNATRESYLYVHS